MAKQKDKPEDNNFGESKEPRESSDNNDGLDIAQFSEDFFQQLDRQVNGNIIDGALADNNVGEEKDSIDNLKARYEGSSREAKRLADELKKYQEYDSFIPVVDAMKQDPELLNKVKEHISGELAPQAVLKKMNLDEDFIFDSDEAVRNPSSDSGRVLAAMLEQAVEQKLAQKSITEKRVTSEKEKEKQILEDFQSRHKIPDEDLREFLSWAEQERLTLDHLWALRNITSRDQKVVNEALTARQRHLEKMSSIPRTLVGRNAPSDDISPEKKLFQAIKHLDQEDSMFG